MLDYEIDNVIRRYYWDGCSIDSGDLPLYLCMDQLVPADDILDVLELN